MKKRIVRVVLPAVITIALVSYTLGQELLAGRSPSL